MRIARGPHVGEVTVVDGIAFLLELRDHRRHVDRIPDDDRIRHEIQTEGLMGSPSKVLMFCSNFEPP